MSKRQSDFAAHMGALFALIGLFIAISLFNHHMVTPGMDVGDEHAALTRARMYGILTGIPVGGTIGFWIGKLIQHLRKAKTKEKAQ
ncbi:MAG: hypothetical protein KJ871_01780 [Alphaproteobacteria bacterium]|nr:hypothetical protein [Alphaproteobacteria bacterium]MBU2084475.1 hypothetical protein [Alphaproteobacteria bacterium]MBU2142483.1 hypothetical protein [Alphaproteobacteria bacterium]MBU2197764.1 hypothetical protein [Alphaproteobacteria bacterium]